MATKKEEAAQTTTSGAEEPKTKFNDPSVYKREVARGPEVNVPENDYLTLDIHVNLWETQSEQSIAQRFARLETQELQIRSTMEQLKANGGETSEDFGQLTVKHNEVVRQMEHMKKTIKPGSVLMLGKVKGTIQLKPGMEWNHCLDRHVILKDGKIDRILWASPV
jgi:hypothetical protein